MGTPLQAGGWDREQHRQKQVHQDISDGVICRLWQHCHRGNIFLCIQLPSSFKCLQVEGRKSAMKEVDRQNTYCLMSPAHVYPQVELEQRCRVIETVRPLLSVSQTLYCRTITDRRHPAVQSRSLQLAALQCNCMCTVLTLMQMQPSHIVCVSDSGRRQCKCMLWGHSRAIQFHKLD